MWSPNGAHIMGRTYVKYETRLNLLDSGVNVLAYCATKKVLLNSVELSAKLIFSLKMKI
jgi:hypothetical protein